MFWGRPGDRRSELNLNKRVRFYRNRKLERAGQIPLSGRSEIVPRFVPSLEEMNIESRKDSKAAKTALHICVKVTVPATKTNPEQGTRSESYEPQLYALRAVSGDGRCRPDRPTRNSAPAFPNVAKTNVRKSPTVCGDLRSRLLQPVC